MKKIIVFMALVMLLLCGCSSNKDMYRDTFYSDMGEYEAVKNIMVDCYNSNDVSESLELWKTKSRLSFRIDSEKVNVSRDVNVPGGEENLQKVVDFLKVHTHYDCIIVTEKTVKFSNTEGSVCMVYSREGVKSEAPTDHHEVIDLGDGWYFMISSAN